MSSKMPAPDTGASDNPGASEFSLSPPWTRLRSSLRYRLLLLVLLAVLPALALILSTAWEQRRQAAVGAQEDALRLARSIASDHARLIESTRSLLTGLAQLSAVQMHNTKACSALFAEVQRRFPLYADIGAIRLDGHVFCSARPRREPANVARQPFFENALANREFTASDYVIDPGSGIPQLTLAYPAVDAAGAAWAVVFAELALSWLDPLADKAQLPAGTVITVTDSTGRILARHPDPGDWMGRTAPQWALVEAIKRRPGEGTLAAVGLEGVPHLFAYAPFSTPKHSTPLFVSVGIPREAALADANRLLIRNLLWTGLVVVLVIVAAAIVSDLFVLRRVNAVVRAARRLTAGDLSARAEVRGTDEIGMMALTFNVMAKRLQARVRDEEAIKTGLSERVSELDLLNHMGELFQSCLTREEAYEVINGLVPRLFPAEAGAVFATNPGPNLLEAVASWGASPPDASPFPPDHCWALRNGRAHVVEDTSSGVLCLHLASPPPGAYLCMPLVAQGSALGVLHVSSEKLAHARTRLAETVAGQLGLGLANVHLREILRSQSIHDPLTGLFNRRYMEETLEREVHRARRGRQPMVVLMMDIDSFKQQNDTFGHDAGDAVLRQMAALLQANLRREDIACRYGGEEFVLVLPDASLESATRRAEQLRRGVKDMRVAHNDLLLGPITVSIGVAAFPDHGGNAAGLLKAADTALYAAKRAGRDRVSVATQIGPAPVF